MALPFIIYLMSGILTLPAEINLSFSRTLSTERTYPGLPIEVAVTVTNYGKDLESIWVEDVLSPDLSVEKGSPTHIAALKSGQQITWKYTITGKRGCFTLDSIKVVTQDSFGIIRQAQNFPTFGQLIILPPILKLKRVSIHPRNTRVYSGEIPARSGGSGVDFFGVRQYQPGDPPNWINWQASARNNSILYSNEYEQERVADVGIILDGRERINTIASQASIFEYSVLAAATLANAFLAQGNRVGLLHYGKYLQWTFPGYGKVQLESILRALSDVTPGQSLVFEYLKYLPTQIFPSKSQIVLISPLKGDDPEILLQIRARGYQLLVISPDPIAFETNQLPPTKQVQLASRILNLERTLLIRKLLRGGIRVVNWDVALPLDHVVSSLVQAPRRANALEFNHE